MNERDTRTCQCPMGGSLPGGGFGATDYSDVQGVEGLTIARVALLASSDMSKKAGVGCQSNITKSSDVILTTEAAAAAPSARLRVIY